MPRQRSRRALFGALGLVLVAACSDDVKPRGQLMIAITSDLSVDKDMDEVRVEVSRDDGTVLPTREIPILPSAPVPFGKPLPGTLAITPPDAGGEAVHVRISARHTDPLTGDKTNRIVREAIAKVPTDRVALLRMPLHWLCDGKVKTDDGVTFRSDCGKDETCKAGACVGSTVDGNDMPDYEPALVYGGGDQKGHGSSCLDALACFAKTQVQTPDSSDCSVPLPEGADPAQLNVALVLPAMSAGHCSAGKSQDGVCYVPLDSDPEEGFAIDDDKIRLPPAACERGNLLGVSVSTSCATKDISIPVCGPWTGWDQPTAGAGGGSSSGSAGSGGRGSIASGASGGVLNGFGGSGGMSVGGATTSTGGTLGEAGEGPLGEGGDAPSSCPVVAKSARSYYYVLVDTSAAMQSALPAVQSVLSTFASEPSSAGVLFALQQAKAQCQADYSTPAFPFTALPVSQLPQFQADALKQVKLDDAMTQTLDTLEAIDEPASKTLVVITGGVDTQCGTTADLIKVPVTRALQEHIGLQPLIVTGTDPQTLAAGFQVTGAPTPLVVMGNSLQPAVLLKGLEQVRDSVGPCTFVGPTTSKFSAALVSADGKSITQLARVDSSAKCVDRPSYYQIGDVIRLCPTACTARGTSSVVTDTCDLDGVGGSTGGAGGAGGKAGASGAGGGGGAAMCPSPPHAGTLKNLSIDDFEDGDVQVVVTEGRDAYWYTNTDTLGLGSQILPAPKTLALPSSSGCHNGSLYCMTVSGSVAANDDLTTFATLAFDFTSVTPKCAYNATAYRGVRFWAKGNSRIRVNYLTTDIETPENGGTCRTGCYDGYGLFVDLDETWQQFTVPFDSVTQQGYGAPSTFNPARLTAMNFGFLPGSFQASFDDLTFY